MKFVYYRDRSRRTWRWRLVARNGKIIGDSAEGYDRRYQVTRAVDRVRRGIRAGARGVWA